MKAYIAAHEENDVDTKVAEADHVSSALIERVDSMLQNLEKEIDDVDAKIGDRWRVLDRDHDGKVAPEEVAAAAMYLKDTIGKEGVQELISNLSKDKDGKILVEDIVRLGSRIEEENNTEDSEESYKQYPPFYWIFLVMQKYLNHLLRLHTNLFECVNSMLSIKDREASEYPGPRVWKRVI
ncbi:hypothetical protein Leryth_006240 [Lithospermum erythrorhizon]|nr:hypothetical protein Leryth_006240 [Lithospermum erythrorhizon]